MGHISAIVLAAGESTRMRRLKALLPWRGSTLVEYQVYSLLRAGVSQVVLVVGHRGEEVAAPVRGRPDVEVAFNGEYRLGKTTSVKAGLRLVAPSATGVLVLAVDQPRPAHMLESLVKAHLERDALITCPVYRGHTGHPLIFASSLLPELMSITEAGEGLREVTLRYRDETHRLEVDTPVVTLDVNSPEDVEDAERLFGDS